MQCLQHLYLGCVVFFLRVDVADIPRQYLPSVMLSIDCLGREVRSNMQVANDWLVLELLLLKGCLEKKDIVHPALVQCAYDLATCSNVVCMPCRPQPGSAVHLVWPLIFIAEHQTSKVSDSRPLLCPMAGVQ